MSADVKALPLRTGRSKQIVDNRQQRVVQEVGALVQQLARRWSEAEILAFLQVVERIVARQQDWVLTGR